MRNKFEILMIIEGEIATTQIIERFLLSLTSYGFTYKKCVSGDLQESDFNVNTIPLFLRCSNPSLIFWINFLKRKKHPYLYYLDDDFWQLRGDSSVDKYYQDKLIRTTLAYIISRATTVLTNSLELAKSLVKFNNSTQVLPPFVDFSLIQKKQYIPSTEIRIGFAGSSTRVDDLDIISPAIYKIIEEYPEVVFEFAGVLPHLVMVSEKIRFFPHIASYSEYLKFQMERQWDIGLAPLVDNASNRCKTNNKYREYGACGIAGIYSDVLPYQRSVKSGVTGIMIDNSSESWLLEIKRLIENPALRKQISENAYKDVFSKYSIDVVLESWLNSIELIIAQLKLSKPMIKKFQRLRYLFQRLHFFAYLMYIKLLIAYKSGHLIKTLMRYVGKFFKLCFRRVINFFKIFQPQ